MPERALEVRSKRSRQDFRYENRQRHFDPSELRGWQYCGSLVRNRERYSKWLACTKAYEEERLLARVFQWLNARATRSRVLSKWDEQTPTAFNAKTERLRSEFNALAEQWQRETQHLSQVSKKIVHPAYLRIVGMGEAVVPLLLEALRDTPAHWFVALRATSNEDPVKIGATPNEAREAWLSWGRTRGFIR